MSTLLMAKAMEMTVGSSLRKLVLIKLCDNANDEGVCWPSHAYIAKHCEMSKRSVINHIKALEEANYLTIERVVKNKEKQVNRYHIHLEKVDVSSAGDSLLPNAANSRPSANDSLPPSAGAAHRTCQSLEPVKEDKKTKQKKSDLDWSAIELTDQQKTDILNLRKAANAKLTQRALDAIIREIQQAWHWGISFDESIDIWALRGWKSFKAEWAKKHRFGESHGNNHTNHAQPVAGKFSADDVFKHGEQLHPAAGGEFSSAPVREVNPEVRNRVHESVQNFGALPESGHGLGAGHQGGGVNSQGFEAGNRSSDSSQDIDWANKSVPTQSSGVSGSLPVNEFMGAAESTHARAGVSPSMQCSPTVEGSPSPGTVLDCA